MPEIPSPEEKMNSFDIGRDLERTHPDRLKTASLFRPNGDKRYKHNQSKMNAFIKEAKSKGYTIMNVDGVDHITGIGYVGLILFKEIDGIELAYNPRWDRSLNIKLHI